MPASTSARRRSCCSSIATPRILAANRHPGEREQDSGAAAMPEDLAAEEPAPAGLVAPH